MKAIILEKDNETHTARLGDFPEQDLMDGDVTVRVTHSTVNYKDGLTITNKLPVVRRYPMIPGIDLAGIVESSEHSGFGPGDAVVLNGWGIGETHLGGYAPRARVKSDWLVPLPDGLSPAQAMAIGTAGYTSMLCVMALERHGLTPDHGPALVTGAAGGVGSVAVALLRDLGWHVTASTGRLEEAGYLKELGAHEVIDRSELAKPAKPLGTERWAATVDSVGSTTLATALSMTRYGGAAAACGLAGGMDLPSSVAPFILRGVSLLGIDSVYAPKPLRVEAWERLARDLDLAKLAGMTRTISLDDVIPAANAILEGKVRGRLVVEME